MVFFALSTCKACKKTKMLLDSHGVNYLYGALHTVDRVSRDKLLEKLRQHNPKETFTTIVINGGKRVIIGYSEEEIREVLQLEN